MDFKVFHFFISAIQAETYNKYFQYPKINIHKIFISYKKTRRYIFRQTTSTWL